MICQHSIMSKQIRPICYIYPNNTQTTSRNKQRPKRSRERAPPTPTQTPPLHPTLHHNTPAPPQTTHHLPPNPTPTKTTTPTHNTTIKLKINNITSLTFSIAIYSYTVEICNEIFNRN